MKSIEDVRDHEPIEPRYRVDGTNLVLRIEEAYGYQLSVAGSDGNVLESLTRELREAFHGQQITVESARAMARWLRDTQAPAADTPAAGIPDTNPAR